MTLRAGPNPIGTVDAAQNAADMLLEAEEAAATCDQHLAIADGWMRLAQLMAEKPELAPPPEMKIGVKLPDGQERVITDPHPTGLGTTPGVSHGFPIHPCT